MAQEDSHRQLPRKWHLSSQVSYHHALSGCSFKYALPLCDDDPKCAWVNREHGTRCFDLLGVPAGGRAEPCNGAHVTLQAETSEFAGFAIASSFCTMCARPF